MRKILLLILLLCAPLMAQTSYYADRAVGVSPFGNILGLVPIQYGQVRVCDLPLTQISPCLPLAPITGVPGFPVDTSGNKFGQVQTLVTGQFAFGCVASTNLQIQVASQSSNTPQLSYPVSCPGGTTVTSATHNLLSLTHPDTVPKSPPDVGDLIYGSPVGNPPTGIWSTLGIGTRYEALQVGAKVLGKSSPEWGPIHLDQSAAVTGILPVGNGGTGVSTMTIHGVLVGQTTSPIHITTAGNATECLTSNGAGADPTFQACPGGSNPCVVSQATSWYVDPGALTGDTTGDGTAGLPWQTVQHAVDQLPGIVCGRYTIHLATPETTFVFTEVTVGASAVYSYSSFAGTTPYIGEVVVISGFGIAGNNKTGTVTGVDLGLSTITLALTTQANEVHAGVAYGNHYLGGVVVNGRVFAGGNGGGSNDPGLTTWPINDANYGTLAYSWLLIVGDSTDTAPSTFVIEPAASNSPGVAVAGGNVTLQGLKILKGSFGVEASLGAFVNLNGVWLDKQFTGMLAEEGSTIHLDGFDYVDPAFTSSVLITNSTNYGWVISSDSLLTDYSSDGNTSASNIILGVDGPVGIACGLVQYSRVWFRGHINCLTGSTVAAGIVAAHSRLSIATMTMDGQSLAGGGTGGKGLHLESSELSGAPFGGGNWTIQNFNGTLGKGIDWDTYSWVDSLPSFSGNTVDWFYNLLAPPAPLNHPAYVANVTVIGSAAAIGTTTIAPQTGTVDTGTYRVTLVINCKAVGAGDTITPTVTYKDASGTTQTLTAAAADCTALGAGSITSINAVFRAERQTGLISYETAIANTPLYDITVTLERLTID